MKFLARFRNLDKWLGIICLFLIILSVLTHVIFRLLNHPLVGAEELESYLFVFMVYISIGYVTREHSHIRFDTILLLLPPRARMILERILNGACAVIFGIATYSSIVQTATNTVNKTAVLGIPYTAFFLPTSVGFLLMTVEYAIYTVRPAADNNEPT